MNPQHEELPCRLIRLAARRAPAALAQRLEEEWLADCATRCGRVARLRLALGCCWASSVIGHEHAATVLAASPAGGEESLTANLQHDLTSVSRRTGVVFLIVCLHGLVLFAFGTGIVTQIESPPPPTHIAFLPEPHTPPQAPAPLEPRFQPTKIWVEQPQFPPIPAPEDTDATRDGAISPPTAVPEPSAPAPVVKRVVGGPGQGFPATEDYYPLSAIHLGEEGVATVRVCVDERGRLSALPSLVQSSGSARLDDGALKLAKAGSGHYRPTTEGGRPVGSCYPLRVRFDLRIR